MKRTALVIVGLLMPALTHADARLDATEAEALKAARAHYNKCKKAFDLSDYQRALSECKASYEIHPTPLLLFSIAQAYRMLPDPKTALEFYKRYIAEAPNGQEASSAKAQIAQLEPLVAAQVSNQASPPANIPPTNEVTPLPSPVPATAPPAKPMRTDSEAAAPSRGRRALVAGATLTALTVASAIAGGALLGRGLKLDDDARAATTVDSRDSLHSSAIDFQTSGSVLLGLAGAALVSASISWGIYGAEHHRLTVTRPRVTTRAVTVTACLVPGFAGLRMGGSW